jgi:chromate transport protein ChrA
MLYSTRFTPVECAMKAQAAIVAEADVVGIATDELVLVRKTKGNMFQTVVRAELTPAEEGTAIDLTAGMDRIVFVFAMIFLVAFVLVNVIYLVALLRIFSSFQFSDQDRKDWLFISLPFISLVLLVGLAQLGRYMSRDEGPVLTRLLVEAMDAKSQKAKLAPKPAPAPAPAPPQGVDTPE